MSARLSSRSIVSPSSHWLTPKLQVSFSRCFSVCRRMAEIRARSSSAMRRAAARSRPSSNMANSSPPSRPVMAFSPATSRATPRMASSPTSCPYTSLMRLKWSMSITMAQSVWPRPQTCCALSKNARRLSTPVRGSVNAQPQQILLHIGETLGRAQPGIEFLGGRRLPDEIVGTAVERFDQLVLVAVAGHQDDIFERFSGADERAHLVVARGEQARDEFQHRAAWVDDDDTHEKSAHEVEAKGRPAGNSVCRTLAPCHSLSVNAGRIAAGMLKQCRCNISNFSECRARIETATPGLSRWSGHFSSASPISSDSPG